jgi:hypothetical protein
LAEQQPPQNAYIIFQGRKKKVSTMGECPHRGVSSLSLSLEKKSSMERN